jgi:uncharacterized protein YndB with AHSA1/START domain
VTQLTDRKVSHDTFSIERRYPVPPSRVYAAFADPATKAKWFTGPEDWVEVESTLDFRVGGAEVVRRGPEGGPVHGFVARFHDLVANQRIVYAYDLTFDDTLISVSVASIELEADGEGTRLRFTEQGAFLDGHEQPATREEGTHFLLDALGSYLDAAGSFLEAM